MLASADQASQLTKVEHVHLQRILQLAYPAVCFIPQHMTHESQQSLLVTGPDAAKPFL